MPLICFLLNCSPSSHRTLFTFCLTLITCGCSCAFGQEPSLFLSPQDFKARLQVAERQVWAKSDLTALLKSADEYPDSYKQRFGLKEAVPPPEGGQWLHWYACPDSGRHLEFRPPDQNICPDTGKNYSGYPYDHVVYQLRNDALAEAALTEALAFRFTNDVKYAQKAAGILNAYEHIYPTYALHDNHGKPTANGAKAYSQTLDESIWLIKLAWTYDLVRGSHVLSEPEKQAIETHVLRASADTVKKAHKEPTDNIQSWINGAIAAVGYTLNDAALISEAIDGPIGFRHQMHAFVQEGFWIEGAWGYQFYAMRPLTMLAQMAQQKGVNLWKEEPSLLRLFHAPLGVVLPNGRLPAFNDSGSPNLYREANLYEVAYAATLDSSLLPVLEHGQRTEREALLFGVEHLSSAQAVKPTSSVFQEAGFAALRSSTNDLTAVVKFGGHGGGHGHFDKLGFVLFSNGTTLAIDPGTQLYGLPIHREWDSMTIAHNTISVDQQRQAASTGKLLKWHADAGWTAITVDAGPVYPQAKLQRTMLLTPEYVAIIDQCTSLDGQPHTFDWAYHNAGSEALLSQLDMRPHEPFPPANGYGHLLNSKRGVSSSPVDLRFTADPARSKLDNDNESHVAGYQLPDAGSHTGTRPSLVALDLDVAKAPDTQVFTGVAPGPDLKVPVPFVLVRRQGASATFVTVLAPALQSSVTAGPRVAIKQTDSHHFQIQGPTFADSFSDEKVFQYTRSSAK